MTLLAIFFFIFKTVFIVKLKKVRSIILALQFFIRPNGVKLMFCFLKRIERMRENRVLLKINNK